MVSELAVLYLFIFFFRSWVKLKLQKITGIHFFSSEDNLGFALVTQPMKGDNYATWSSSTIMALIAGELKSLHSWKKKKKKTRWKRSETSIWIWCNNMLLSLILILVSKKIAATVFFSETGEEIWINLSDCFKVTG